MCCLTVKHDSNIKPHRSKRIIVVIGNNEEIYWENNKNYAPVISYSSLHQLTRIDIDHKRRLHQSDCKNYYTMPPFQTTITPSSKPPLDIHSANWINYGSSIIPYMGYNLDPDTGLTISPVLSKTWA